MKSARAWTGTVAVATAAFAVFSAAPATAATAAATLSIGGAVVAADDLVNVTVTYTCDAGYTGEIVAYVNDSTASAFGGSDEVVATCDGASHTVVIPVDNDNDATDYKAGNSALVAAALDATKTGSPEVDAAQDVTLTLG
ncbi:hypothetical protein [Amycolatopsis samaneae]|uniref:Secreted protein n=1 Tax=Amycolatopsis samaneae TaxID=664691 RepID=A0ABW5GSG6_9PSEU